MVRGKNGWRSSWAYVDSGASYSVFSTEDALRLGLKLYDGEKTSMTVGNGDRICVYLFDLPLKIEDCEIMTTIGFSPDLGIQFNLLGRKDVFEKYKICFDDREAALTFVRNQSD